MDIRQDYSGRVAAAVKTAMEAAGLTIPELSRRSGIARMTLTRRLAGSPFSMDELAQIAPHVGMAPSQITAAAEQVAA